MHSAYKYLHCIGIKCCLHRQGKITKMEINSLLFFRLMAFNHHYTQKRIRGKTDFSSLLLCFIILGSANSFTFLKLDHFQGCFSSPIWFYSYHGNRKNFKNMKALFLKCTILTAKSRSMCISQTILQLF